MKTTPTQRLVKKAIARTRKTGFRRTHISLELLRTELAGWKGEAEGDGKRSVSSAVATVRRDHKRDTEEIERKREHATADSRMPLGGDTVEQVGKVHVIPISEGGRYVRGMDVRITSDA